MLSDMVTSLFAFVMVGIIIGAGNAMQDLVRMTALYSELLQDEVVAISPPPPPHHWTWVKKMHRRVHAWIRKRSDVRVASGLAGHDRPAPCVDHISVPQERTHNKESGSERSRPVKLRASLYSEKIQ